MVEKRIEINLKKTTKLYPHTNKKKYEKSEQPKIKRNTLEQWKNSNNSKPKNINK